jgi:hypothetical protein
MKRLRSLKDEIALLIVGVITAGVVVFAFAVWLHFASARARYQKTHHPATEVTSGHPAK